jgi:hypothetical protein
MFGGLVRGELVVVVERGGNREWRGSEGGLSFDFERERESRITSREMRNERDCKENRRRALKLFFSLSLR